MRRILYVILAACMCQSLGQESRAQLVQVGPGFVKAPFVRVYHYPDGSSFVRVPFVAVHTPGYRMVHPYVAPTDCNQMDWGLLSQAVRQRSAQLDAELDRLPEGKTWRSQLKTSEIVALVPESMDSPPPEEIRHQLRQILASYNAPIASPQFRGVASLASFQRLRTALEEYTTPAPQRLRRQLLLAAAELSRSVAPLSTGRAWQEYLWLRPGMPLSWDKAEEAESPPSRAELAHVLSRFDAINQSSEYRVISDLPAFKTTHERLASFIKLPEQPSDMRPEELPAPTPDTES